MNLLATIVFCSTLLILCYGEKCNPNGTWNCYDGRMQTLEFTDSNVEMFQFSDNCTLTQEGKWSIKRGHLNLRFSGLDDGSDCITAGKPEEGCSCYEGDLRFTINPTCTNLTGPNGEHCVPAIGTGDCHKRSNCYEKDIMVQDPNYTPGGLGCGAVKLVHQSGSAILNTFETYSNCCSAHDYCYSNCSMSKAECDQEFYTCTFCSCYSSFTTSAETSSCQEHACLFYQALDNFGCDAYKTAQGNACMCQSETSATSSRLYQEIPNKFGTGLLRRRTSAFTCDATFYPVCHFYL
jgi:hypothetical protein